MFKIFKNRSFWTILFTVVVLLAVIKSSAGNTREITMLEKLIRESYAPLQSGMDKVKQGIGQSLIRMAGGPDVEEQLNTLTIKNNLLSLENSQLRENKAEVERLRSLLNYKQIEDAQYVLEAARVIARSPNNWYKTMTIDKGASSGIAVNMPVINPDGLVGKVVSVSNNSAQISLITDREMAVGAILEETRETRGIVEGLGDNGKLRIINIPYYAPVHDNERVISSGLSEIFPPGIPIGRISDIQKEATGLVLSASVEPAVKFDQLEEVLVIKQFKGTVEQGGKGE
ncbi:MAG: rod shape-determining protein MreC [Syntrophomonadaceae bacterium]|nr:rod shape-determining protein MreC [Syntrophomonadaceae bacterium]